MGRGEGILGRGEREGGRVCVCVKSTLLKTWYSKIEDCDMYNNFQSSESKL